MVLTTCALYILVFSLPLPPASYSSPVDITSCLLQPSFPPGQPPSVVFATPPPPQMNPTPQPRQVGPPTPHPPHSTTTPIHRWTAVFWKKSHIIKTASFRSFFSAANVTVCMFGQGSQGHGKPGKNHGI